MQNVGFSSRPMNGIPPTGDAFSSVTQGFTTRLMLADGIGHGPRAEAIAALLVKQFEWFSRRSNDFPPVAQCLLNLDHTLRRLDQQDAQAAVTIVDIDCNKHVICSAGIGNVDAFYFHLGQAQHFAPMKGMIGGCMPPHLSLHHAPIEVPSIVALITDGIDSRSARSTLCTLSGSSSFTAQHAQVIANNIVRASCIPYDDASCALFFILT